MKLLIVVLKIALHISVTGIVCAAIYFYVWKQREDLSDDEIRDRMWLLCLIVTIVLVVLLVASSTVRRI